MSPSIVSLATAPIQGAEVVIRRLTNITERPVKFTGLEVSAGAAIELDSLFDWYINQELNDTYTLNTSLQKYVEAIQTATLAMNVTGADKVACAASETNARASENAALDAKNATQSLHDAIVSNTTTASNVATSASQSKDAAKASELASKASENASKASETAAAASESVALNSKAAAETAASTAMNKAEAAGVSAANAANSAAVASASNIVERIGTSGPAAGRNLADNADFQIWAQGESVTVADGGSGMCADRYQIANLSGAGVTTTMTKGTMQVDGAARACGMVSLSAAVATYASGKFVVPFMHVFEGRSVYRYLSPGKSFTVAVAVEVSVAGKYAFAVRNADFSFSYVHTATLAANTPTIVQFTVPIPTTSGVWNCPNTVYRGLDLLIGAVGSGTYVAPSTDGWLSGNYYTTADCVNWTATTGATVKITRVRLEEGTVLGAYQAKTYDEDKARCAYFYREMTISIRQYAAGANAVSTCPITWADMRVAPTWVLGANLGTTNAILFYVASQSASSGHALLQAAAAGDSYTTRVIKSSGAEL